MNWKEYLTNKGYIYSKMNNDYRMGLGWGKSIKIWTIIKGLFVIEVNNKIVYKDFPESFEQFKTIVNGIKH